MSGLILICVGLAFLLGNLYQIGGEVLFLGLGIAFLAARVLTGRYGYAVPSGILLGFGSYVWLESLQRLPLPAAGGDSGGWFFVLLGLGFLATYVIGARPTEMWPLFPALVLGSFGAAVLGWVSLPPLAAYGGLATLWPLVLVCLGLWLLLRGALARRR